MPLRDAASEMLNELVKSPVKLSEHIKGDWATNRAPRL